jgi:hypothetical protein
MQRDDFAKIKLAPEDTASYSRNQISFTAEDAKIAEIKIEIIKSKNALFPHSRANGNPVFSYRCILSGLPLPRERRVFTKPLSLPNKIFGVGT